MAALIISGEVIFALPFHISRFFRPSLLRVFDLSHAELGAMQSVYGVVAMLAYFPGGALADLFSARKLLTTALLTTALSGPVFASLPGARGLWCLHAQRGTGDTNKNTARPTGGAMGGGDWSQPCSLPSASRCAVPVHQTLPHGRRSSARLSCRW